MLVIWITTIPQDGERHGYFWYYHPTQKGAGGNVSFYKTSNNFCGEEIAVQLFESKNSSSVSSFLLFPTHLPRKTSSLIGSPCCTPSLDQQQKKTLIHIKKTCPHTKNPHPDPIDWSFQLEATPVSDIRSNCFGKWVPVARIEIWILAAHLFRSCIKKMLVYICICIYIYIYIIYHRYWKYIRYIYIEICTAN